MKNDDVPVEINDSPSRILIAEDDLTSRNLLMAFLKKNGYDVVATSNGVEAWAEMQKPDAPKLVIIDWMMPEMDGLEVCRRIREIETTEPPYIIMLTSRDEKTYIIAGFSAGADDYLAKPFNPGELLARIKVGVRLVKMQERLNAQVLELRLALEHIKTLQGILPICSFCKKIRDDKGLWDQVETYISQHSEAEFTHGICPECMKEHYPEYCKNKH
ncbi:response regulator transcription factor [bacterium]|nr:response regulator transcription factor [bacterium]